jgi:hypothetical protein
VDFRLGVQAPRDELREWLRSRAVTGAVGPTEPGGWVAVWLAPDTDPDPLAGELSTAFGSPIAITDVDADEDWATLRVWRDGREIAAHQWEPGVSDPRDTGAVAQLFVTALGRSAVEPELAELAELLRVDGDGSDGPARLRSVIELLGLPAWLVDAQPESMIVLYRGERREARLAASVAGPAWLASFESGWHVLVAATDGDFSQSLVLAASLSNVYRQGTTLTVWRSGGQCGYVLWQRGDAADTHLWSQPWEVIGDTDAMRLEYPHGDATLLATATGHPDDHVLLRALLRRRGEPDELLTELAQLLSLPAEALRVLDGRSKPDQLPGAEHVERAPMMRAGWAEIRRQAAGDSGKTLRGVVTFWMYTFTALAAFCALIMAFALTMLAINGAFADHEDITDRDIFDTIRVAVLTVAVTGFALTCRWWLRRNAGGNRSR